MKILVTGARGFLGSHIYKHYVNLGNVVTSYSYRADNDRQARAEIVELIRNIKPDLIINAGASQNGKDDPDAVHELLLSNVALPGYVAWAIKNHAPDCLFITFGSSWQFDDENDQWPFNAYAASKTAAEDLLTHYAQDGVRMASLRLYDTYGPGDNRNKVVNLIADAMNGRTILNMSGGEQEIDLIHIKDVIAAVDQTKQLLSERADGCLLKYAVRSCQPIQIKEIARIMSEIRDLDVSSMVNLGFYPYRKRERFVLDCKQERVPGWRAEIKLEDGLRDLMEMRRQQNR